MIVCLAVVNGLGFVGSFFPRGVRLRSYVTFEFLLWLDVLWIAGGMTPCGAAEAALFLCGKHMFVLLVLTLELGAVLDEIIQTHSTFYSFVLPRASPVYKLVFTVLKS